MSEAKGVVAPRIAVRRVEAGSGLPHALLSFSDDDGVWKVQVNSTDSAFAGSIEAALSRLVPSECAACPENDASRPQQWHSVVAAMRLAGFDVTELPLHDHRVTVSHNARTGRQLASYDALHEFATPDENIAKRVATITAKVLASFGLELMNRISALLKDGDHSRAAGAVRGAFQRGVFALPVDGSLLDVLVGIDHRVLNADDRRLVLRCVVLTAEKLQRHERGREAAELLLADRDAGLTEAERSAFEMVVAIAMIKAGTTESGLMILRRLSRRHDLPADTRAWTWRNISLALPRESDEARIAAERSSEAFLEAGEKSEAARSLGRAILCAMSDEPGVALATFDRILAIIDAHGLQDRALRASALHESAQMLASMRRHSEAFERAVHAAELRAGLLGYEPERIASLHLASFEAKLAGHNEAADKCDLDARSLARSQEGSRAAFADRIKQLFESYSSETVNAEPKVTHPQPESPVEF